MIARPLHSLPSPDGGSTRPEEDAVGRLAREIARLAGNELELTVALADAGAELRKRDDYLRELEAEIARCTALAHDAHAELARMRSTRLWRAGAAWWALKAALRRRSARG